MPQWHIEETHEYQRQRDWFKKKRPDELEAVLANLVRYARHLCAAKHSKDVGGGFLHREPGEVVAVTEKGHGNNLRPTRLYTYADDRDRTLFVITIGDKDGQSEDIAYCKAFVNTLFDTT